MARMRSVKPEFWGDEELATTVSRDARLLYIGLWNLADEHSRLRGDPRYIKGQLFPYDDDIDARGIQSLLAQLISRKKVVAYFADGASYLYLPNLAKHQRLEGDKVPSRLPPPAETSGADSSVPPSEPRANESAPDADSSKLARARLLSMEHVAGGIEHVGDSAPRADRARRRSRDDAEFDRFWAAYPRHEAKATARKAWDKAILRADPDRILAAAQAYRDQPGRDPKFTAHAATWLNADRWLDERPPRGSPNGLVEHDGLLLKPETSARLADNARFQAMDQQRLAIEGTAP